MYVAKGKDNDQEAMDSTDENESQILFLPWI